MASYMRAVLRTLAQCHAQHILHRDIKPGETACRAESVTPRKTKLESCAARWHSSTPSATIAASLTPPLSPAPLPRQLFAAER